MSVDCEAAYKRSVAASGRIMQHAHIGFRGVDRTLEAIRTVHGTCAERGIIVDRFGITLDWSMGFPPDLRAQRPRGTGIVLGGPEDFARITGAVPAAAHFGDFMLGLPGAVENTRAALAAGVTSIGNLGQYFTFRLPYWDDDIATTEATVIALGLIAAQPVEVLVHSNLDDGFAGLFADISSALGMVLIEKYIVEELVGARLSHCYGHHFTAPSMRMAFHRALAEVSDVPGTMIYGNTVSYKSTPAGNFASLASYLQADIWALRRRATGHAINPVPVTENERIPDTDEIVDAQTFAARLVDHALVSYNLIDFAEVDATAASLVAAAKDFARNVLIGLGGMGVDVKDAAQIMIALKRLGPKRIEALFGAGAENQESWSGRQAIVLAEWVEELEADAAAWVARVPVETRELIAERGLRVCVGSSDVHEHGKKLIESMLAGLDVVVVDGGTSVDPEAVVETAVRTRCDAIAVGTYNGIALRYARDLVEAVGRSGQTIPLCLGGRLNQVLDDSNSGLPVDVTPDIRALGVVACGTPADLVGVLAEIASRRPAGNYAASTT
jgi:methylmalonyl-CoA mutase cobalamin-binding subunit